MSVGFFEFKLGALFFSLSAVLDTGSLEVYMEGSMRLLALGTLSSYLPPSALQKIEQLPSLLVVFLCHCSKAAVDSWLPFWSQSISSTHAVSGIWLGLPGRESSARLSTEPVTRVTGTVILLGLFIYTRERFFEFQVAPKFTDGLLFTCFDALLRHDKGTPELRLPDVRTREYAEVLQLQQKAHAKATELVLYLRSVLSGGTAPSVELCKALRIAVAHERLQVDPETRDLVEADQLRIWQYKSVQQLKFEQVRQILITHDGVTHAKELVELPGLSRRLFFRIENTTGISVLSALGSTALSRTFCAELADNEQHFVIVGMFPEDYFAHSRWGMFQTIRHLVREQQNGHPQIPEWSIYPLALQIAQLWLFPKIERVKTRAKGFKEEEEKAEEDEAWKTETEIWALALTMLRDWAGFEPLSTHVFLDEARYLHEQIWPVLVQRYTTLQLWQLLPMLLAFDAESDDLRKEQPGPVFPLNTHTDKLGNLQLWYQLVDYIALAGPGTMETVINNIRYTPTRPLTECADLKFVALAKNTEKTGPYALNNLQTQSLLAHAAEQTIADCKHDDEGTHRTWQAFALLEQQRCNTSGSVVYPLPSIGGGGGQQHQCLRMTDWPIACVTSKKDTRHLFCDSYFPVFEVDRRRLAASLDVSDRFFFIRAAFKHHLNDKKIDIVENGPQLTYLSPPPRLLLTDGKQQQQQQENKGRNNKRKSPEAPQYSPEPDQEREQYSPDHPEYSPKRNESDKHRNTRIKLTHDRMTTRHTMSLEFDFRSSTEL